MGRRGNNEGTITKRADGRWEARLSLPNGKRKSFYGKTRQEVARRLTAAQHDLASGLPVIAEKQTVQQYLTFWLEIARTHTDASTQRRYENQIHLHIVPAIGKTILSKLTEQEVQLLYTTKLQQGLANATVRQMHAVLHQALKDAVRMGLLQRNVTEMVILPRQERPEMTPLDEEQANRFLKAVAGDRFEALFVLAVTTGMRQGELLGLRWQDVDLDQALVQVRQALQQVREPNGKYVYALAEPKTASSRRKIALSHLAVDALHAHRLRQVEERLALGSAWHEQGLVFPNAIGELMQPYTLLHRFKRILEQNNLPAIRFHDLRHTAATIALSRGVNVKMVSEMLGHSSIKITLDIYGHVLPHMQQAVAAMMDAVFAKEPDAGGCRQNCRQSIEQHGPFGSIPGK